MKTKHEQDSESILSKLRKKHTTDVLLLYCFIRYRMKSAMAVMITTSATIPATIPTMVQIPRPPSSWVLSAAVTGVKVVTAVDVVAGSVGEIMTFVS